MMMLIKWTTAKYLQANQMYTVQTDCSIVCFQFKNVVNWIILDYYAVTIAKIVGASVSPVARIMAAMHSEHGVQ